MLPAMAKNVRNLSLLILRMTLRDWRAGELRLLLAALLVSVAALSSVGFLTERTRAAIEGDSRRMVGGDLVISTDSAPDPAIVRAAQAPGLRRTATITLVSMATPTSVSTDAAVPMPRLVSVKGVGPEYPLFGGLVLRGASGAEALRPGTAWIDGALAASAGLGEGDALEIGRRRFSIARVIDVEPDRRPSMLNLAPRVMIGLPELEAMDLIGPGTRAVWRLHVAGDAAALQTLRAAVSKIHGDKPGLAIDTPESSRMQMAELLERAHSFLSLVSLLAVVLASIALAIATRRFVLRHIDACAMLRCLGLRQREVALLFLGEFALLGIAAGALGAVLGYAAHLALLQMLGDMANAVAAASAGWRPALQGVGVALVLLAGFGLPQLLQMLGVSHVALVRREARKPGVPALLTAGLGLAMLVVLLLWQTGDVAVSLGVLLGLPLLAGAFALLGWFGLALLERSPLRRSGLAWQFALASLCRRKGAAIVQMVALALGLVALLLLTVVKLDLLAEWRAATPAGAPNHYVGNIQPDQLEEVNGALAKVGKATPHSSIRSRLAAVNGQPPKNAKKQAQSLQASEWELSTAVALPAWYKLTEGSWPKAGAPAQLSVDEGVAKGEGFKLGDVLTFDVAGEVVHAPITSVRKTDWRSRQGSYAMLLNEDAVPSLPRTYTTTLHVPPGSESAMAALAARHPNLVVFNMGFFVNQIERVVGQLTAAVEFLFMFVLAAGLLVLYTALIATQDERANQAALLRALGAARRTLSSAQWLEHLLSGAAAGVLAALGATLGHWALAKFVFKLEWHMSPLLWGAGMAAGLVCAAAGGWLALRPVLNQPPLHSLRQA
jgi:putative ABC transport system permease protein